MKLRNQKRIAAKILKVGKKKQYQSQSRSRARKIAEQKRKGRRKGHGSRKGKSTARLPTKRTWINKVRLQRDLLLVLKEKKLITNKTYREMRRKVKGGFFRTRSHISLYLKEHNLIKQ